MRIGALKARLVALDAQHRTLIETYERAVAAARQARQLGLRIEAQQAILREFIDQATATDSGGVSSRVWGKSKAN